MSYPGALPLSRIHQPFRPVHPGDAGILAERIDAAVVELKRLGQRMGPGNRLQLAAKELRRIQAAGEYPIEHERRIRAGNAVRIAFATDAIVNMLASGIPTGLRPILPRFLAGRLDDTGPTEAHQAESELHWGAICAAGGLQPRVPMDQAGKSPDFVVRAKGLDIALEVKRPGSVEYLEATMRDGLGQCTEFGCRYNALIIDLSDVITPDSATAALDRGALVRVSKRFEALAVEASAIAEDRRTQDPFDTLLYLGVSAEAFAWKLEGGGLIIPAARFFSYHEVFPRAASGLIVDQSRALREGIVEGMRALGAAVTELWRA